MSVVIPTCNRPALLARAIKSVLDQTFIHHEVLVVDDAPSAETSDVVRQAGDARIRVLSHDGPRGAGAARNAGLRAARGEFVGFLDDDDTWQPTKLERQLARFSDANEQLGVVYCSSLKYSDISQRVIENTPARPLKDGYVDFLRSTRFGTSVPLIRRNVLIEVGGFDESLPGTQDRDLWIRLARCCAFDFVPDVLVWHHIHGPQITSDLRSKITAREMFLDKYQGDFAGHPDIHATYLWRLGMLYCADGRHGPGRRFLWRAIRVRPGLTGAWRDLAQSLVGPARLQRRLLDRVFRGVDGVPFYY